MTRIILRCCLVLAFTGVLLTTAQDTTSQSREASSSSPESSSKSVESSTFYSPESKAEDESSSIPRFSTESAAKSSSENIPSKMVTASSSKSTAEDVSEYYVDSTTPSVEYESTVTSQNQEDNPFVSNASNAEILHKAELQGAEDSGTEIPQEKSSDSSKELASQKGENVSNSDTADGKDSSLSQESDTTSAAGEDETTTQFDAFTSTEVSETEINAKDSEQNNVPSKEKTISSSSSVDQKETLSTTPSKIQTDENELNETAKSATRKRSLNATNAMSKATTVMISEPFSSSVTATTFSANTVPPSEGSSFNDEVVVTTSNTNHKDLGAVSTHDSLEAEMTSFPPHIINSALQNAATDKDIGAAHFDQSDHIGVEVASVSYTQDAHTAPVSSAALSNLRDDSLHPLESMNTRAQTFNAVLKTSSESPNPQKPPDRELDSAASINHSELLVTFDPDGMTHNFSQEPDSVTFPPGVFHINGMPSDEFLSRLENDEFIGHKTEAMPDTVKFTESTTNIPDLNFSEREREIETSNPNLFVHDEPDIDIMTTRNVNLSTKKPAEPQPFSTSEPIVISTVVTSGSKIMLPSNDESEEMLNDSPHFVQIQSKSTAIPTTEVKNVSVDKNLEIHVSNDITHSASFSPQNTPETVNELDFSTEYQTEQSEIRPVTAVSPLKTSESITILPVLPKIVSHSPPEAATSEQPDKVLPHASSPIILPNPAPSLINQSAETTTGVLQSENIAQKNSSDSKSKPEDGTTVNTVSTISGVAVKTSVSVSFPLLNIPNDTKNSSLLQTEKDVDLSFNTSKVILPVPINKDADRHPPSTVIFTAVSSVAPTEAPSPSTTASGGIRIRIPRPRGPTSEGSSAPPPSPRTRKPFISPPKKPSTTEGPSVPSIFSKPRTRLASITSSTTARPIAQFSTIRIHYASRIPGMLPGRELVISTEPVTTTLATTTETEEPFSDEPFTEQTQGPIFPSEDNVTLLKVAGYIVVTKGLRWNSQLNERRSPLYKERADFVQKQLYRLFRTSPMASHLWKIEIDGFSIKGTVRHVAIDFFLYLVKTENDFSMEQLTTVFHDKLKNYTFSRFTVDTNETAFQYVSDELMHSTTEPPEKEPEPIIPQWAIAVIVVGAASLIFIVLFAAVAILGRHHVRRRYSSKLNDEDSERPSDWESKMAAAYENLAADTIYDAEDLHTDTYKKRYPNITYHGRPSQLRRADSWSSSDWSPPPRRPRPQVHRIVV